MAYEQLGQMWIGDYHRLLQTEIDEGFRMSAEDQLSKETQWHWRHLIYPVRQKYMKKRMFPRHVRRGEYKKRYDVMNSKCWGPRAQVVMDDDIVDTEIDSTDIDDM